MQRLSCPSAAVSCDILSCSSGPEKYYLVIPVMSGNSSHKCSVFSEMPLTSGSYLIAQDRPLPVSNQMMLFA